MTPPRRPRLRVRGCLRNPWVVFTMLGVAMMLRGICYLPPVVQATERIPAVEEYAPVEVWAAIWIIAGLAVVGLSSARRGFRHIVAISATLPAAWGMIFLAAFVTGQSSAGYLTLLTMGTMTVLTLSYTDAIEEVPGRDCEMVDPRGDPEQEVG
ncbi:hypothetical protein PQI66_00425 [Corynebacterium sp. USCH3]|uniref:hypothetical protein n=1 Tax=Corynebacterium sp. USCH3 TaxID=3024840 RepID=UPI003095F566